MVGLTVSLLILFANARVGYLAKGAEEEGLEAADERLGVMKQTVLGIKAMKLSAWKASFLEQLTAARLRECKPLYRFRSLLQTTVQLGCASPILAACCSFIFLAMTGGELRASDTFAALNVFLSLWLPLIILPGVPEISHAHHTDTRACA